MPRDDIVYRRVLCRGGIYKQVPFKETYTPKELKQRENELTAEGYLPGVPASLDDESMREQSESDKDNCGTSDFDTEREATLADSEHDSNTEDDVEPAATVKGPVLGRVPANEKAGKSMRGYDDIANRPIVPLGNHQSFLKALRQGGTDASLIEEVSDVLSIVKAEPWKQDHARMADIHSKFQVFYDKWDADERIGCNGLWNKQGGIQKGPPRGRDIHGIDVTGDYPPLEYESSANGGYDPKSPLMRLFDHVGILDLFSTDKVAFSDDHNCKHTSRRGSPLMPVPVAESYPGDTPEEIAFHRATAIGRKSLKVQLLDAFWHVSLGQGAQNRHFEAYQEACHSYDELTLKIDSLCPATEKDGNTIHQKCSCTYTLYLFRFRPDRRESGGEHKVLFTPMMHLTCILYARGKLTWSHYDGGVYSQFIFDTILSLKDRSTPKPAYLPYRCYPDGDAPSRFFHQVRSFANKLKDTSIEGVVEQVGQNFADELAHFLSVHQNRFQNGFLPTPKPSPLNPVALADWIFFAYNKRSKSVALPTPLLDHPFLAEFSDTGPVLRPGGSALSEQQMKGINVALPVPLLGHAFLAEFSSTGPVIQNGLRERGERSLVARDGEDAAWINRRSKVVKEVVDYLFRRSTDATHTHKYIRSFLVRQCGVDWVDYEGTSPERRKDICIEELLRSRELSEDQVSEITKLWSSTSKLGSVAQEDLDKLALQIHEHYRTSSATFDGLKQLGALEKYWRRIMLVLGKSTSNSKRPSSAESRKIIATYFRDREDWPAGLYEPDEYDEDVSLKLWSA